MQKNTTKKAPLPFDISGVADAETVDYNIDRNISNKSTQIAAKKIVKKTQEFSKEKT